ncbi:rod shape-determining protein [Carboxydochorda subterranea]|uniref:Cell shape-determining protein MreB n=1 Tax=Carboxydichorda subterranea TaxID=3109565 RepID=A0ABZ1C0X3_9FIRM|nr:rod shape-determining protein [Limnochorda sp. L945t]WRP18653.1 rod shape-determining protein [Limnochorda sp. L945t]
MLASDVAVDLGTATVLVYVRGRGIVLHEPSVVAVDAEQGEVLAVGQAAREMGGRAPDSVSVVRPLRGGVVASYEMTRIMLRYFLQKALGKLPWVRPRVVVGIPPSITQVERRALVDACIQAGAREVHLVSQPLAAALGAGIEVDRPQGHLVVDIGGGTTDVAVLSAGGEAVVGSVRVAGDQMDEAVMRLLRRRHNLLIGERTAEELKIRAGTVEPHLPASDAGVAVWGQDGVTSMPRVATVTAPELREALMEPVRLIADAVREVLERTPPELAGDIADHGVVLAGGGALLKGIDEAMVRRLGLPVTIADDPIGCVVRGLGRVLDEMHHAPRNSPARARQAA